MRSSRRTLDRIETIQDHGGRIQAATERFGAPAEGWLDLSTGINPYAYPVPRLAQEIWARLPDSDLFLGARQAALAYFGAAQEGGIVEAPGSQALIQVLPRAVRRARIAIVGFTYAEHARCWRAAGHDVSEVDGIDASEDASVVVVANPNNPDGRLLGQTALEATRERLAASGGLLVIDEAFVDVVPENSLAKWAGRPALCLLRSFGKFFGLAGLRLGYALTEPQLAAALESLLGPWRVSGPALQIARLAMSDRAWIEATRRKLAGAAARLDRLLAEAGLAVIGGTDLFRLVEHAEAERLFLALCRHGILLRRFAPRPRWLRLGLPADEASWMRLEQGLGAALAAASQAAGPTE
jgi:cobalamin biosynthetic protein CobC